MFTGRSGPAPGLDVAGRRQFGAHVFAPPDIASLEFWYRAGSGVTPNGGTPTLAASWADQSGNGRTQLQATEAAQPTIVTSDAAFNSHPVLSFSGYQFMQAVFGVTLPQPLTVFACGTITNQTYGTMFDGTGLRTLLRRLNATWSVYGGTTELFSGNVADSSPHVFAVVFNGASTSCYVDSTAVSVMSGDAGADGMAGLTVQSDPSGAVYPGQGKAAELFGYSGALTAAQIAQCMRYLGTKYGLVVT